MRFLFGDRNYKALVVDDDEVASSVIAHYLTKEGLKVYFASNGFLAVEVALKIKPDIVLLDITIPGIDGIEVCEVLRKNQHLSHTKIIFITARIEDYSQIAGFEAGADDYIVKPVKPRILLYRINALMRRSVQEINSNFMEHDTATLSIDVEKFLVYVNGNEVVLTKKEFEILLLLKSNIRKVFSRDEIYAELWPLSSKESCKRNIDVHILKLRKKLGGNYIKTYKGLGYSLIM